MEYRQKFLARLGPFIRARRLGQKMTLQDVATVTGLSVSYLSEIERGVVEPSIKTLHKLAEALWFHVSHLFQDAEILVYELPADERELLEAWRREDYSAILQLVAIELP